MSAAPRWSPDHLLVDAILAGSTRTMADLVKGDREWAVAGLHRAGLSVTEMEDRLKCSRRAVMSLMVEPMTLLSALHMDEIDHFTEELRLVRSELTVALGAAAEANAELARVREQRDRMIDAAMVGERVRMCAKGRHVLDRYNVYTNPNTGKSQCIACRREGMAEARALARQNRGNRVPPPANPGLAPPAAALGAPADGLAGGAPTAGPGGDARPPTPAS